MESASIASSWSTITWCTGLVVVARTRSTRFPRIQPDLASGNVEMTISSGA